VVTTDWPVFAATLLGSIGTVGAWGATYFLLRREVDRDRDRDERAKREQASRVSAWFGQQEKIDRMTPKPRAPWGAFVRNASELPIYEVQVDFLLPSPPGELHDYRGSVAISRVPPSDEPIFIPAGQELRKAAGTDTAGNPIYTESFGGFAVAITFTDAANNVWRRNDHGHLQVRPTATPRRGRWRRLDRTRFLGGIRQT
jgi:hypothetical protein